MRSRMGIITLAILMLSFCTLSGCLVAPPHEAATNDPGTYPENFERKIRAYLDIRLRHPDSLKDFTIEKKPEKVSLDAAYPFIPLYKGQKVWEVFVAYDSKNKQGNYTGRDLHVVWIRHNRIVAFDYGETELEHRIEERMQNSGY